ncbi:hypothetical protein K3728_10730 [Rhodobacteraceae bacterium M385]|nr:hypothetical protein K3728_10730 [Rhodobacteraceae bacterium M385]
MEGGNAMGVAFAVIYGGYTLILLFVAFLGVWLLRYPAQKRAGVIILCLLVAWCIGPPLYDRAIAWSERRAIDAATILPDDLSFEGQRVLVIESSSTMCDEFCGDLLRLGVPGEIYWLGIGNFSGGEPPNPEFAAIDANSEIWRVRLGERNEEAGGMRFAEPVENAAIPPFDVIVIDDNGYLRSYAPQILGLPDRLVRRTQVARVLIEGWPNPYVGAPPEPTYRSVAPWMDMRALVYWPLQTNDHPYPSFSSVMEAWMAPVCANAAPPEGRDEFTYYYRCAPDQMHRLYQ